MRLGSTKLGSTDSTTYPPPTSTEIQGV
eukprot:COSAG02_NODE_53400_length_302_cov_0.743842_2_plen_27_part_01